MSGVAALFACLGALALIGCEPGAGVDGNQQMPTDVLAFRAKRDECDHFRVEEATDQARAAFLEKTLARTCTGTDAELASLKRRYAGRPAIMAALSHYDGRIE